jgi:argininosuccinate synthase
VEVNGESLDSLSLLTALNEIGARHGVGRSDILEDRLVGIKSRGVYETPGGTLLYTALQELETLVLDRRTLTLKDQIADRYADLVYEGRWWTTEREAMDALVNVIQRRVDGKVRLKLYKGGITIAGRRSANALYDPELATFGEGAAYDHADAAGFIRLFGLPMRGVGSAAGEGTGKDAVAQLLAELADAR